MGFNKVEFKKDVSRLSWFGLIYLTFFHSFSMYVTPIFNKMKLGGEDGQNGVLSMLLVLFGLILFGVYSRGKVREFIKTSRKQMTVKVFCLSTICVIGVQFILILISPLFEMIFNLLGYSLQASNAAGSVQGVNWSIFLYGAVIAPIAEELIFRGAMQSSIAKYGRVFAIVFIAVIFALMHANITQAVFAFFVGIIFGYIAMEYSLFWAIALHLMNNLVYTELIVPQIGGLPMLLTLGFFIGMIIILFIYRKAIQEYRINYQAKNEMYRIAYTTLPFILMTVVAVIFALFKVNPL